MISKAIIKKVTYILSILVIILIINIFPKKNDYISSRENITKGVIYMLDNNEYLSMTDIVFSSNNKYENIKEIVSVLSNNKTSRKGFVGPLNKDTKVINISINDKHAIIDFNNNFLKNNNLEKCIESLVYSITSIKGINKISILVDGKSINGFDSILDKNIDINRNSSVLTFKNNDKTTIYYPAIYDEYLYYVPVTKYENNTKEKIEIIIDELKSSSTYNSNFVSYLNNETKLINYEINENDISLFFESITLNKDDIEEEVKYAISLSVKDNYDINNIKYYMNNNLVDNYFLLLG